MRRCILYLLILPLAYPILPLHAQQEVSSLLSAGQNLYLSGRFSEAETVFRQAVEQDSKSGPAHYWLGMALYEQDNLDKAEGLFKRAMRLDKKSALGHMGLGLVYLKTPKRRMDARAAMREAVKRAPDDAQIQYYMGMTFVGQNKAGKLLSAEADGRAYFQKVVTLDPDHPDAYYQLGLSYEYPQQAYDQAIFLYFRQLSVTPDHRDALLHLGTICYVSERYEQALDLIDQLTIMHGEETAPLFRVVRAQMEAAHYHSQQMYDKAWEAYELYLTSVDAAERAYYEDLKYIAAPDEYETYLGATEDEQPEIVRRFWASRDPNPATVVNERLVEHDRRVMFAREYFAGGKTPWDRRGDIYIRYGDPDDRQRFLGGSNEEDVFMTTRNPFGSSIRERSFRTGGNEEDFVRPTDNPQVDAIREVNRQTRYQLRARGAHASESWVYITYALELFFVDQRGDGNYDYPNIMMDPTAIFSQVAGARQEKFHPATIAELLINRRPEDYQHEFGGDPLQFVFDMVTFRGEDQQTEVELILSLPTWQLGSVQDGNGLRTHLDTHVSLRDAEFRNAVSNVQRYGPLDRPAAPQARRQLDVDMHAISAIFIAPAGAYESAVEIQDVATRKIGVYKKPVVLADYRGDSLMISDIKLADDIKPSNDEGAFIRNGLRISPNAGHLYQRGQLVYVYYEIYNLHQDDVGVTQYETLYEVTPKGAVLRDRSQQTAEDEQSVLLSYDESGLSRDDVKFTGLDTSMLAPGEYELSLVVTDRHSGQRTSRTTTFVVMGLN
jgi:GWxTD domain-containing protein